MTVIEITSGVAAPAVMSRGQPKGRLTDGAGPRRQVAPVTFWNLASFFG